MQFEFTEEGLGAGWCPEGYLEKDVIPWHELAWMAGSEHPDLTTELEFLKEKSEIEGYRLGLQRAIDELEKKIAQIDIVWTETENPFLKKFAVDVRKAVDETKAVIERMK